MGNAMTIACLLIKPAHLIATFNTVLIILWEEGVLGLLPTIP